MSLFQCEECGCCENTALAMQGFKYMNKYFDWEGIEDRREKLLCAACGPTKYHDLKPTGFGVWHDKFDRIFLPMERFKTNRKGNLEHIESGSEDFRQYAQEPGNG